MLSASLNTTSMSCSTSSTLRSPAAEHVLENLHRPAGLLDRQALGRLVQHQQPRLLRDRHGDLEQALVAVRQHGGGRIGEAGEPHALHRLVGDGGRRGQHAAAAEEAPAPAVARLRRDAHVLARGQGGKDVAELEGARDALLRHRDAPAVR